MSHACLAITAAVICLAATGCAVKGDSFARAEVPPGNAVVYVYRPYSYAGSLLAPEVTCGGETAKIGPGGYHAFVVAASPTVCRVQGGESADAIAIDSSPRVHYVREEIGWGVLSGHPHLDPVDADQAQSEIQHCCVEQP
jgi:hypothetical protein